MLALLASACGGGGATRATPAVTATPILTQKAITPAATVATPSREAAATIAAGGPYDPLKGQPVSVPVPGGPRGAGQVRALAKNLVDQQQCYQLGEADAAQDQSAGATMNLATAEGSDTGFLISGFGQTGQGTEGMPTTIAWVESGIIKAEVVVIGGSLQVPCGKAYADGYAGYEFQSY